MRVEVNRPSSSSKTYVANTAKDNDYKHKKTERQTDGQRDPVLIVWRDCGRVVGDVEKDEKVGVPAPGSTLYPNGGN